MGLKSTPAVLQHALVLREGRGVLTCLGVHAAWDRGHCASGEGGLPGPHQLGSRQRGLRCKVNREQTPMVYGRCQVGVSPRLLGPLRILIQNCWESQGGHSSGKAM